MEFIIDRKPEDMEDLERLKKKIILRTASSDEWQQWLAGMQGAINHQDMIRIESHIIELANALKRFGFAVVIEWISFEKGEYFSQEKAEKLLKQVGQLRNVLVSQNVPTVPDNLFGYTGVNDIEQILMQVAAFAKGCEIRNPFCGESHVGDGWSL